MNEPDNGPDRGKRWMAVGLAMVISLWVHVLGLALLRYAPPVAAAPPPAPIVLELELPYPAEEKPKVPPQPEKETPPQTEKTQDEKPRITAPPDLAAVDKEEAPSAPPPPPKEETISLESKAPEYLSYLGRVKAGIKTRWIFPPVAREQRATGRLTAIFTLDRAGALQNIVVERSSGHDILDEAALEAIRGAAPYPPFPEHINLDRLNIRAQFDYRIRFIGVN